MKLKHENLAIETERPFANCKLDREQYANILTSLVKNYSKGFVLAINNEWGTGKTTFVKMWEQMLKIQGFKTLYFNAWENDFENGATTALMSELSTIKETSTEILFNKVVEKGAVLTKSLIPILIKSAIAKHLDIDILKDCLNDITENADKLLQSQIEEYQLKKKGLKEFKKSLEDFIKKSSSDKPIVFIIDELDRCRPDYAVEVLEKLKHFFSVPGIVFVLSIDKIQLGNAVRGVYGSENINADEYLRRFIDLEYSIPEPKTELFCKYLYEYFEFDAFFYSQKRNNYGELQHDSNKFIEMSVRLFKYGKLTLRQQEKIFAHARVVINCFKSNNYIFPSMFVMLIYIKLHHPDLYSNLNTKKLSIQEMIEKVETILPNIKNKEESRTFAYAMVYLVYFYNNMDGYNKSYLFEDNEQFERKFKWKSRLNIENDNIFEEIIPLISNRIEYNNLSLSFLFSKIDLIDNFHID